ncbi:FAD-binding oxidoreductase [Paroceanicella profunda]|uniref:FAD-binding oxidoreductase n=1 Tax=Paroceanicella profunda TaxID=2579971 RepID=A0A5B8FSV1_9RHOB|nr:FAD-binding oxidoreductase [Paroceanicella profunda]QDL90394.1 FAD-binding oxidoreductase [Paroceanicella profunda]
MPDAPPFPDIASLWQETAAPRPVFGRLETDTACDVAIIGGGYTGLCAARALAGFGLAPVVLEASRVGWGASGRNGGVVGAKFRIAFSEMAKRFGLETARRMHALGQAAVEGVGETVESLAIEGADYRPTGALRCAHTPGHLAALRAEADWLRDVLGDSHVRLLGPEETARETGSQDFCGSMLTGHGGIIHPLNYAFGLARGVQAAGVPLFEESPALRLERERGGLRVITPRGSLWAKQVLIATNGYSDLTPATAAVRRGVIPFRSAMIATAPLTGAQAADLLPEGRSYTETRRMMRWFRRADGRLLYGGRGAFGTSDRASAFAALERAMLRQFPGLEGHPVTHRWSGLVAMTLDSLPHLGPAEDRVVHCLGYNGTGVAMASHIGREAARLLCGETPDAGLLGSLPLRPVPFYPLRAPAVRAVAGWYQLLDALGR